MNFEQLATRYRELLAQRQAGVLDQAQFVAQVQQLRLQDANQRWWQIDPASGAWLCWDGSQWQPATPPGVQAGAPPQQTTQGQGSAQPDNAAATVAAATGFFRGLWRRFLDRMIAPGEFLRQGRLPLAERSQGWWDVLGVAGGALSGYLWFLYASIRGMPHVKLIGMSGGRDAWYDFLPAMALAALPFLLFAFRGQLLARLDPIWSKVRLSPSYGLKLAGGIVGGILALNYLGPVLFSWAFAFREGLDLTTPLLMVALPLGLALFRQETDHWLAPLQSFRQSIPKFVLVGIALAIPYALAFLLYRLSFNQYELLHWNVILGVLIPYVLLRNPQNATPLSGQSGKPGTFAMLPWFLPLLVLGLLLSVAFIPEAYADDCLRDIFNMRDCLRTGGYAETMSGTASSVVSVLVNGSEIRRIFIVPPPPPPAKTDGGKTKADGEEPPPRVFRVQVTFRDNQNRERNVFYADMQDRITISAWVEEDTPEGTVGVYSDIRMTLQSGGDWARLDPGESASVATVMHLVRKDGVPFEPDVHIAPPLVMVSATVPTASAPITTPLRFSARRFSVQLSGPASIA